MAHVRHRIRTGAFSPGQKIPAEQVLADELGVGRSSVREAVRSLAEAGVIDVRRGDGSFITDLAPRSLLARVHKAVALVHADHHAELHETWVLLQTEVAALSARRRTDAHLAALERTLVTSPGDDSPCDVDFHRALSMSSGNTALEALAIGLLDGWATTSLINRELPRRDTATGDHRLIFEAVSARDPHLAAAATRLHLSRLSPA